MLRFQSMTKVGLNDDKILIIWPRIASLKKKKKIEREQDVCITKQNTNIFVSCACKKYDIHSSDTSLLKLAVK
jgi:hypothetical protein